MQQIKQNGPIIWLRCFAALQAWPTSSALPSRSRPVLALYLRQATAANNRAGLIAPLIRLEQACQWDATKSGELRHLQLEDSFSCKNFVQNHVHQPGDQRDRECCCCGINFSASDMGDPAFACMRNGAEGGGDEARSYAGKRRSDLQHFFGLAARSTVSEGAVWLQVQREGIATTDCYCRCLEGLRSSRGRGSWRRYSRRAKRRQTQE